MVDLTRNSPITENVSDCFAFPLEVLRPLREYIMEMADGTEERLMVCPALRDGAIKILGGVSARGKVIEY